MPRFGAAIALLIAIAGVSMDASARVRAVRHRSEAPVSWLLRNAHVLHSTQLVADRSDLEPLRHLIGSASVVGLGDATHGTREFFTVKLRLLDFLVREMGFDVLALEAPFPITERLNVYVQGGPGDPRALLHELDARLLYLFWNSAELLATIEWMRDYNLHRGDKAAIEVAGADIYDEHGAVEGVLAYLRPLDPAAASEAELDYICVVSGQRSSGCRNMAAAVRDRLAARRDELVPISGLRAFNDAVHHADTVMTRFGDLIGPVRDRAMAENVLWIRAHRGSARKVVFWGHQEHVGETPSPNWVLGESAGTVLAEELGDDYFTIGTLTGSGSYAVWKRLTGNQFLRIVEMFDAPEPGMYEWYFRQRAVAAMLIPLDTATPWWLAAPARFRTAGTSRAGVKNESLPAKLDAVIFIDITTPTSPL